MKDLTFITGNAHKAKYLEMWLGLPIAHHKLDLVEIQSLDPKEVVTHKVTEAYRQLQRPVLVEDVSLTFHALGKLPGTLVKWFLEELDVDGLCRLLDGYDDRTATVSIIYGLCDGELIRYFEGRAEGRIAPQPRGDRGFGWNPVFIPDGWQKTYAEMSDEEMGRVSFRAKAIAKLRAHLTEV
jgi:XTP/dITP diphosphohydrolase